MSQLLNSPREEPLGVGLLYNNALPAFIRRHVDSVDYVSLIPDMSWMDHGPRAEPRYEVFDEWADTLSWIAARRPLVAHNIGLSIGSVGLPDEGYVRQLARYHDLYRFRWHSDHLAFFQVSGAEGGEHNAGLAIPVPYDEEVLDLVAERVAHVRAAIDAPFLVENNVYFVDLPEQEMTEPEFLNRLCGRAGCGLLLDLHNLYTNAVNHGLDPREFLARLDLSHVVEMHVAGGDEFAGMYTDSHAGPCPDPVWELLDAAAAASPNLRGITYEFNASYYPLMEEEGVLAQLARVRAAWERRGSLLSSPAA